MQTTRTGCGTPGHACASCVDVKAMHIKRMQATAANGNREGVGAVGDMRAMIAQLYALVRDMMGQHGMSETESYGQDAGKSTSFLREDKGVESQNDDADALQEMAQMRRLLQKVKSYRAAGYVREHPAGKVGKEREAKGGPMSTDRALDYGLMTDTSNVGADATKLITDTDKTMEKYQASNQMVRKLEKLGFVMGRKYTVGQVDAMLQNHAIGRLAAATDDWQPQPEQMLISARYTDELAAYKQPVSEATGGFVTDAELERGRRAASLDAAGLTIEERLAIKTELSAMGMLD